jgi:hypothetical protein
VIADGFRLAFSHLARAMCEQFASKITPRVIMNRSGDSPYLERYYLLGGPSEEGEFADAPLTVMLHRFVRSDEDSALHSHPWEQSVSFVLAGGYSEERRVATRLAQAIRYDVERRDVPPFSFNFIAADDFHRVDLFEKDAWTLFVTARKIGSWSFWDRDSGKTTPWREFIATIRGVDPSTVAAAKRSESIGVRCSCSPAKRCDRCGWPLKAAVADGCVVGNCSQRPLPDRRSHCAECGGAL